MEEIAKKHLDHKILKQNAAERAEQALTLAYNGGLFKITPELMTFVGVYGSRHDSMFVKDEYNNPIKIESTGDFYEKMIAKYQEVMNDWYNEYEEIRRVRKAEQL